MFHPDYFIIEELVCPDVYSQFGEGAWQFFDPRLLITIDALRVKINRPIFVNNWKDGGRFQERGFRCLRCTVVQDNIIANNVYCSPHMRGQGVDFDIQGMVAEEVRQWILKNQNLWPYPIRLENNVSWVHLDVVDVEKGKVYLFNS